MLSVETLKEIAKIDERAYFIIVMKTAEEGFYCEEGDKCIQVENMCGGRYLGRYKGFVVAQFDDEIEAYNFLKNYNGN